MGWWKVPDNMGVVTGDAVLDAVSHFLRDFCNQYQNDLSRKPTLQELEYALTLAFKVNVDDDVLQDFEDQEVKQVGIKSSRRKKRRKVMPGDIFSYKLEEQCYGFGRIVSEVSVGSIVEIFDHFASQPIFDFSLEKRWLIPPMPIESYSLLEVGSIGDWRIIAHDPEFVPGKKFESIRYVLGTPPHALMAIDIYGNQERIEEAEAKKLPKYYGFDDFYFKKLIKEHLFQQRNKATS